MIERVAEEMYTEAVANRGDVLDLGVWGSPLYRREAERLVGQMLSRAGWDPAAEQRREGS